jgi:hypothetical protein
MVCHEHGKLAALEVAYQQASSRLAAPKCGQIQAWQSAGAHSCNQQRGVHSRLSQAQCHPEAIACAETCSHQIILLRAAEGMRIQIDL